MEHRIDDTDLQPISLIEARYHKNKIFKDTYFVEYLKHINDYLDKKLERLLGKY